MPTPQPSEIAVPSITREVLSTQGLIKGVGTKKKYMQQPKPKMAFKAKPVKKSSGMPVFFDANKEMQEAVKLQGGKTPLSVSKQISEKGGYEVKYGPGLYKKKKK